MSAPRRVAIIGSRDYPKLQAVSEYVRTLPPDTTVVSGGARGVDTQAERVYGDRLSDKIFLHSFGDEWPGPHCIDGVFCWDTFKAEKVEA